LSQNAKDLLELRRDDPMSIELRKLALNIIAPGIKSQLEGG
jgi:hypothetical protein